MKKKTIKLSVVSAMIVGFSGVLFANAGTVGYWRFDGGTSGVAIATATSEVNSPAMDGEQWSSNATNVLYSSDKVGPYIYDPVTSGYTANTGSMLAPASASTDNSQIVVHDMTVLDGSFTLEMFVKVEDSGGAADFAASKLNRVFNLDGSSSCNGNIGSSSGGSTYLKFLLGGTINDYSSNFEDETWHHMAYVADYDGTNTTVEMFYDYKSKGTTSLSGKFTTYSYGDLRFGVSSSSLSDFDWFLDEVRLSDSALTTNQFLQVSYEAPATDLMLTSINVQDVVALTGGTTQSGTVYRLQYTENLTNATWTSLPLYLEGGDTNLFFVDPTGVYTQRFYRLIEQ